MVIDKVKVRERLVAKITIDSCGHWLYKGKPDKEGYCRITINNRSFYAHRISYLAFKGDLALPEIDHDCRIKTCINPSHLVNCTTKYNTRKASGWSYKDGFWYCPLGHLVTDDMRYSSNRCRQCTKLYERSYYR